MTLNIPCSCWGFIEETAKKKKKSKTNTHPPRQHPIFVSEINEKEMNF